MVSHRIVIMKTQRGLCVLLRSRLPLQVCFRPLTFESNLETLILLDREEVSGYPVTLLEVLVKKVVGPCRLSFSFERIIRLYQIVVDSESLLKILDSRPLLCKSFQRTSSISLVFDSIRNVYSVVTTIYKPQSYYFISDIHIHVHNTYLYNLR